MSSRVLATLLACLLAVSLLAGPVAAVESSSDDIPEEAEVGSSVEATFELTELFDEFESWTLAGETELTEVTWTVRQFDGAGNQVEQHSTDGQEVAEDIDIDDGTARVEVRVTGTTPELGNLSYDPADAFTFANLTQERAGGADREIDTYEVHHYTEDSKAARNAIDSAAEAVEQSGSSDAETTLQDAIGFYENGDFERAINTAERAEDQASQSLLIRNVALYGGVAVVILLLAGGGFYVYKSRQQGPSRLK